MSEEENPMLASYRAGCARLGELEMRKVSFNEKIDEEIAQTRASLKAIGTAIAAQRQVEEASKKS